MQLNNIYFNLVNYNFYMILSITDMLSGKNKQFLCLINSSISNYLIIYKYTQDYHSNTF